MYFNSRPSARGDTPRRRKQQTKAYFNSRPSARGDLQLNAGMFLANFISIHAPPRGATVQLVQRVRPRAISIHAPPRGATRFSNHRCIFLLFQFTPLREGRPVFFVSSEFSSVVFQFTPLREGRRYTACVGGTGILFQFTPLREGRRWRPSRTCRPTNFNSRPSARGDGDGLLRAGGAGCISIHAPPRGATSRRKLLCNLWRISIHAPPRGATI